MLKSRDRFKRSWYSFPWANRGVSPLYFTVHEQACRLLLHVFQHLKCGQQAIYPILSSGFISVRNTGSKGRDLVHSKHINHVDLVTVANKDMYGGFGLLQIIGTNGHELAAFKDSFFAFKAQLADFIRFLRKGIRPFPFAETEELMKLVIAGIRSREQGSREVFLEEIK